MERAGSSGDAAEGAADDPLPSEQEVEERTRQESDRLDELVEDARDARERIERADERP